MTQGVLFSLLGKNLEKSNNKSNNSNSLMPLGTRVAIVVSIIAIVVSIMSFFAERNINKWKKDFEIKNTEDLKIINKWKKDFEIKNAEDQRIFNEWKKDFEIKNAEDQRIFNEWKKDFLLDYAAYRRKNKLQLKAIRHRDELVKFKGSLNSASKGLNLELWYIKPKETVTPKNIEICIYPHLGLKGKVKSYPLEKLKTKKAFLHFEYFVWDEHRVKIHNVLALLDRNINVNNFLVSPLYEFRGIAIEILYNGGPGLEPLRELILKSIGELE